MGRGILTMTTSIFDGKSYTEVSFSLPYKLPFDGTYEFEDSDLLFHVNVEHIQIYDRRSEELLGMKFSGSGSITTSDQYGMSHISKIIIKLTNEPEDDEADDKAKETACQCLNRVIDVYREVTRDYRVTHVKSQHDVLSFSIIRMDTEGHGRQVFQLGHKNKFVYPVRIQPFEESREVIQEMLKSGLYIPLWSEYRHEARKHFDERRFPLSVVLMNSAIELFWADILRRGLIQQGEDPSEIRKRMNKWLGTKNTLKTLDKALKVIFGVSLEEEESNLWQNLEKARVLRKNVLHAWAKAPDLEETYESMANIENVFSWFFNNVLPRLRTDNSVTKTS